ncbi:GTP-binding protein [Actinomadura rubrisoli]|uniref:Cobalamin biosynthesis protein CobW n=1 Tax=Actinomadura rubrisoli TaxID=2530368 RepID=A0A4R5C508_9ACTN|nr:GTP-binding protein [Actinomadura rubrisoli]TDD93719.1 cobalamin biosynthesis protein CobW [Actinomadura rubrisoli]
MPSIPVAIVSGLHAEARGETVRRLLTSTPHAVAVHHDLRGFPQGRVDRVVLDAWGIRERTEVPIAHGCASCTIREDVQPAIEGLAADARLLVVETWGSVEPRAIASEVSKVTGVRLAAVLTAVDPGALLDDLSCRDRLATRALTAAATDERHVAETLARQIEYASGLVLGEGTAPEPARTVLEHLGAGTPVTALDDLLCPTGPVSADDLAAKVSPATVRLPCDRDSGDVATVVWRRLRPLHPARLHDALRDLAAAAVRSRGRFWIANRPNTLLSWDCAAGLLAIEDHGPWLAARPRAAWTREPPARRIAAALDWRPKIGDRTQLIAFTGPALDRAALFAVLDGCLLTEDEMLAGSTTWETYADPFAGVLD